MNKRTLELIDILIDEVYLRYRIDCSANVFRQALDAIYYLYDIDYA